MSSQLEDGSCLDYTSILLHLLFDPKGQMSSLSGKKKQIGAAVAEIF